MTPFANGCRNCRLATQRVTIRHLLSHTGGLIDYEEFVADDAPQVHDADVLRLLSRQDRTYFKPGSGYRYSNSGYALLALIVERASGQRFAAFLHDRIFEPLGMNPPSHSRTACRPCRVRAYGYSAAGDSWARTDQSSTSAVLGDGGIYSSIDDLAKWDAALYDDRLLREESRELAFTPATHTDNPSVDYGFGWRITGETLWHSGETRGFRNVIIRYPERKLTVIVLTNRNEPEPYSTALAIARLFLPESASRDPQRRRRSRTAGGDAGRHLLDHAIRAAILASLLRYIPALVLCYFVPALYNSFGLIDGEQSKLYFVASRYLLPATLVLLTLAIDLPATLRLGPKALAMFFAGDRRAWCSAAPWRCSSGKHWRQRASMPSCGAA